MKCPNCRAEIISNTLKTCPYCDSPLAFSLEEKKEAERVANHEISEVAKMIKEAIEAQKAFYKLEKAGTAKKLEKVEERVEWKAERKKYSTLDIVILVVSLALTFIVLAITLSLLLRR